MKKNGELSLEQLRQRLHISKRKAAWMLQNGDMFAVMMNDEYVISREGVIEFFASDKAFRIYNINQSSMRRRLSIVLKLFTLTSNVIFNFAS